MDKANQKKRKLSTNEILLIVGGSLFVLFFVFLFFVWDNYTGIFAKLAPFTFVAAVGVIILALSRPDDKPKEDENGSANNTIQS